MRQVQITEKHMVFLLSSAISAQLLVHLAYLNSALYVAYDIVVRNSQYLDLRSAGSHITFNLFFIFFKLTKTFKTLKALLRLLAWLPKAVVTLR